MAKDNSIDRGEREREKVCNYIMMDSISSKTMWKEETGFAHTNFFTPVVYEWACSSDPLLLKWIAERTIVKKSRLRPY